MNTLRNQIRQQIGELSGNIFPESQIQELRDAFDLIDQEDKPEPELEMAYSVALRKAAIRPKDTDHGDDNPDIREMAVTAWLTGIRKNLFNEELLDAVGEKAAKPTG